MTPTLATPAIVRASLLALLGLATLTAALAWTVNWEKSGVPRANDLYLLPADGPAWTFSGQWSAGAVASQPAFRSSQSGARAVTIFDGSEVELLALRSPAGGWARIWIDGSDSRADLAERGPGGIARLDLSGPQLQLLSLPVASGLPDGRHTLTVEVVGTGPEPDSGGEVFLRGAIAGQSAPRWPLLLGLAGLLAGLVLAIGPPVNYLSGRWGWRPALRTKLAGPENGRGLMGPILLAGILLTLASVTVSDGATDPLTWLRLASLAGLALLGLFWPWAVVTVSATGWLLAPLGVPLGSLALNPGELGLAALTAAWIGRAVLLDRIEISLPRAWLLPLGLLLVAAVIATAGAEYQKVAVRGLRSLVLEPLWLFVLASTYVGGRRRFLLVGAIATAAAVAAAIAIFDGLAVLAQGEPLRRLSGIFGSPNELAFSLERGLPVLVALSAGLIGWHRKALRAGVIGVGLTLVATISRGGLLGAAVGLALQDRLGAGRRRKLLALALLGALALVIVVASLAGLGSDSISVRLQLWDSALQMAAANPIIGIGPDNFLYHLPDYMDPAMWREPNISHPHNLFLDGWLSLGLVGLAILALLVKRAVSTLLADLPARSPLLARLDAAAAAALVAGLAHGLVDHSYFLPSLAAFTWIIFAVAAGRGSEPRGG